MLLTKVLAAAERSIDLVLQERITAPAPKELVQGTWFLRVGSAFSDLDRAADALVRFYKGLGFNAIWGDIGPEVYRHARKHRMLTVQNMGTTYAGNGFTFAACDGPMWKRVPEAGRFQFRDLREVSREPVRGGTQHLRWRHTRVAMRIDRVA